MKVADRLAPIRIRHHIVLGRFSGFITEKINDIRRTVNWITVSVYIRAIDRKPSTNNAENNHTIRLK